MMVIDISADDAAANTGALLLDVREYDEWMAGHAPQAVHIPMHDIPARLAEVPTDRRVVCVCRSGNRSRVVSGWLQARGVDAVNMAGGMRQWSASGHAVVNGAGNQGVVI